MPVIDKKEFRIDMLDDDPVSLDDELDEIELYLKKYDLELNLVKYEKPSELEDGISHNTDVAFIDKNLNDASGIDAIKGIRSKYPLLDVFIYSRAGIKDGELRTLVGFSATEIVHDKEEIVDRLKTLIDKNLSKWEDMDFLRGVVLSKIIDHEQEINDVLVEIFAPSDETEQKFRDLILENPFVSLGTKHKILERITKAMKPKPFVIGDLYVLREHRNLLAHCKRNEDDPTTLVSMGESTTVDRTKIREIFELAEKFSECLKAFKPNKG